MRAIALSPSFSSAGRRLRSACRSDHPPLVLTLFISLILIPCVGASLPAQQVDADAPVDTIPSTEADTLQGPRSGTADGAEGKPVDADGPQSEEQEEDLARYDAWGAKRNVGLAIGEVAGINALVWFYNEYIRQGGFTHVSPQSFWANLSDGFFFDDNHFSNNMFGHPYHGSLYFNAARSNGLNYWESMPFALMGSFFWECCGEVHPPALNDWVATSIGGIAIGEVLYRAGSSFLDNEGTGAGRVFKEIGGFLLNPVRGFNRLVSGRATSVTPNPSSPYDKIPPDLRNFAKLGLRLIGDRTTTESFATDTEEVDGFFAFDLNFGDPWRNTRRKPFDFFTLRLQLNFTDKELIGGLQIWGNLYSKTVKKSEKTHHVFGITQNYDFVNNNAVEFGGQSFGGALMSEWKLSDAWDLQSHLNIHGYLIGAVNSEYAFLAVVPDRERLREYDMGMGAGVWGRVVFAHQHRPIATVRYRFAWLNTMNGSAEVAGDTYHILHWGGVEAVLPLGRWGIGADATAYVRSSFFDLIGFGTVRQDVGEVRLFGVFQTF
jgi:hypothetical protein